MRTLSGIPNTDAPSSDYPGGRIRNKDNTAIPPIVGTPVIEQLYGDIVQFFQRLLVLGSVTANNLADNVTNGYQTITALWNAILGQFAASDGATQSGVATNVFVTPSSLSSRTANEIRSGIAEVASISETLAESDDTRIITPLKFAQKKASDAEIIAGTDTKKYVTPAGLAAKDGGILDKVIEIGDWNMDASNGFTITFATIGITYDKMIQVKAFVRNDDNNSKYPITWENSGNVYISSINGGVSIFRNPGSAFDSTSFDSTSYNRGWIIIQYLP